jgi:hypothetical protein
LFLGIVIIIIQVYKFRNYIESNFQAIGFVSELLGACSAGVSSSQSKPPALEANLPIGRSFLLPLLKVEGGGVESRLGEEKSMSAW